MSFNIYTSNIQYILFQYHISILLISNPNMFLESKNERLIIKNYLLAFKLYRSSKFYARYLKNFYYYSFNKES